MSLNYFDETRPCPKCGAGASVSYGLTSPSGFKVVHTKDVLRRECCRCGFVWYELPLDAEQP